MTLDLPRHLLHRIHRHAEEAYPHECCGFLLGHVVEEARRIVCDVEVVRNPDAVEGVSDRYQIDTADYLRVDRRARLAGWDILGCYHSHPDEKPIPSTIDLACAWPWYVYLIVALDHGHVADARAWVLDEDDGGTKRQFASVMVEGSAT